MVGKGSTTECLSLDAISGLVYEGLPRLIKGKNKILTIIPDLSRSAPIPQIFPIINQIAYSQNCQIDYLIALGTHPALKETEISRLVGLSFNELIEKYPRTRILNHDWKNSSQLTQLGTIPKEDTKQLTEGLLEIEIPVIVNRLVNEYDLILICGPVFPHEVAGFSGGEKYLFPGISGEEIINITHWTGALATSLATIGNMDTPVRRIITRAANFIQTDIAGMAFCMRGKEVHGLYLGGLHETWVEAVKLSERLNIVYVPDKVQTVLSVPSKMYTELWTAAKAMYKMEPIVADGGEVIIYAPELKEISITHGELIQQVGYHVVDFFKDNWEKYNKIPWAVLAHSTHLKGMGKFVNGQENPRINVRLATGIPESICRQINLDYVNPHEISVGDWKSDMHAERLLVRDAGENLYRQKE